MKPIIWENIFWVTVSIRIKPQQIQEWRRRIEVALHHKRGDEEQYQALLVTVVAVVEVVFG